MFGALRRSRSLGPNIKSLSRHAYSIFRRHKSASVVRTHSCRSRIFQNGHEYQDLNLSNITNFSRTQEDVEKDHLAAAINHLDRPALWMLPFALCFRQLNKWLCTYKVGICTQPKRPDTTLRQNFTGLLTGIVVGFVAYSVFLFAFAHSPHLSTLVSAYLMLFTVFGIAFSNEFRCILLLVLPYLAASRMRWLFMLYASSLTLTGPGLNFMHNAGNFRNSIACILSQVSTNMIVMQKLMAAPFSLLRNQLQSMIDNINEALNKMRFSLFNINLSFLKVTTVMDKQSNWIKSLVASCGDQVALENQCLAFFNNIYFNCKATMGLMKFMCSFVRLFASSTCANVQGLNDICDRQAELLQDKTNLTSKEDLGKQMDAIIDVLGRDNLSIVGNLDVYDKMKIESDNTVITILQKKMDSFIAAVEQGKVILSWIVVIWTLITMLQLVLKASLFRKLWLTLDQYDNYYITSAFVKQEKRAIRQGLVPTVPLIGKEKRRFKKLSSFTWTKSECSKAFRSMLILFLWMFSLILVLLADSAMHEILVTVTPIFSQDFSNFGSGARAGREFDPGIGQESTQAEVVGESSMANIIRTMVSMLEPMKEIALDVDATACRPTASPPDEQTKKMIYCTLALTVVTIFIEVYVLRFRHLIMAWYFPNRAVQRAAWLRAHIRNNRGLFHRLIHQIRAVDVKPGRKAPKRSGFGRFLGRNPMLRRALRAVGIRREMCVFCGEEGNPKRVAEFKERFAQCPECAAYYCRICQAELENICMICRCPLFAMAVEVDFEQLSSDEEYESIYASYLHRAEQTAINVDKSVVKDPEVLNEPLITIKRKTIV